MELNKADFPTVHALGLHANREDGRTLKVERVDDEGLVAKHNRLQPTERSMVLAGDRILEVNGIGQSAPRMLEECLNSKIRA